MSWVALIFTPFVLLYQSWTYWIFRKRVRRAEPLTGSIHTSVHRRVPWLAPTARVRCFDGSGERRHSCAARWQSPWAGHRQRPVDRSPGRSPRACAGRPFSHATRRSARSRCPRGPRGREGSRGTRERADQSRLARPVRHLLRIRTLDADAAAERSAVPTRSCSSVRAASTRSRRTSPRYVPALVLSVGAPVGPSRVDGVRPTRGARLSSPSPWRSCRSL